MFETSDCQNTADGRITEPLTKSGKVNIIEM